MHSAASLSASSHWVGHSPVTPFPPVGLGVAVAGLAPELGSATWSAHCHTPRLHKSTVTSPRQGHRPWGQHSAGKEQRVAGLSEYSGRCWVSLRVSRHGWGWDELTFEEFEELDVGRGCRKRLRECEEWVGSVWKQLMLCERGGSRTKIRDLWTTSVFQVRSPTVPAVCARASLRCVSSPSAISWKGDGRKCARLPEGRESCTAL